MKAIVEAAFKVNSSAAGVRWSKYAKMSFQRLRKNLKNIVDVHQGVAQDGQQNTAARYNQA